MSDKGVDVVDLDPETRSSIPSTKIGDSMATGFPPLLFFSFFFKELQDGFGRIGVYGSIVCGRYV